MRKEEKTELTKSKIYAAAIREFGTKGYAAGSINHICRSGINKGLVYHNFRDKDALYLECVKKSCDDLVSFVNENMKSPCFVEYMSLRMKFFTEQEQEASLFLEALTSPPAHLEEQIQVICGKFEELNKAVFEKELEKIELRSSVTRKEALDYFSEVQKLYNFSFAKKSHTDLEHRERVALHEKNIKKIFNLMLYGIAEGGNEE